MPLSALAQSLDLLGVLPSDELKHCPQDRGVHNVHKYTALSLLDQSWTEISNANFIRIVPSSTRILYIVPRTGCSQRTQS